MPISCATALGSPDDLGRFLIERWDAAPESVSFETLSGLGSNRMTTRRIVHLLRDLVEVCRRHGLAIEEILPSVGCGPGTLQNFPQLVERVPPGSIVAKTGTLRETDGGVAVLAGLVRTAAGTRLFSVVAPRTGTDVASARTRQERWLLDRLAADGGAREHGCGPEPFYSDSAVEIVVEPPPE